MTTIKFEELKVLFELILDKLKGDKANDFKFPIDEYWIITSDEWNNFTEEPTPAVSSLKEDIVYLRKSIKNKQISTYSDIDRLASVLRAISEIQAPST